MNENSGLHIDRRWEEKKSMLGAIGGGRLGSHRCIFSRGRWDPLHWRADWRGSRRISGSRQHGARSIKTLQCFNRKFCSAKTCQKKRGEDLRKGYIPASGTHRDRLTKYYRRCGGRVGYGENTGYEVMANVLDKQTEQTNPISMIFL